MVGVAEHLGADTFLHVKIESGELLTVRVDGEMPVNYGDTIFLTPDPEKLHRFDADGLTIRTAN